MDSSNTIIIYSSKYGATKKYACWLSEELNCDLLETKKATIDKVEKYNIIIFGGGIYASGILGISFLKKYYERLKNKKIVAFAVGASPYDEKAIEALRKHNFKDELAGIPCFYCRGAWNEAGMSWKDRMLCGMLKKVVAKKNPEDYEPWEAALMQAIGSNHDWTDKDNLKPIIELIRKYEAEN